MLSENKTQVNVQKPPLFACIFQIQAYIELLDLYAVEIHGLPPSAMVSVEKSGNVDKMNPGKKILWFLGQLPERV